MAKKAAKPSGRIKKASKGEEKVTKVKEKRLSKTEEQTAQKYRDQALESMRNVDSGYIKLAEALFEIKNKEYYRDWGSPNFQAYCKGELGVEYTKATQLINIYDRMKGLKLNPARLEKIGWSKAKELIKVADESNAAMLLKKAEQSTFLEFKEIVLKIQGRNATTSTQRSFFSVKFDAASNEGSVVAEAIKQAEKEFETTDASTALAAIVGQWLTEGGRKTDVDMEALCGVLSRAYGGVFSFVPDSMEKALDAEDEEDETEEDEEDSEDEDLEEDEEDEETEEE